LEKGWFNTAMADPKSRYQEITLSSYDGYRRIAADWEAEFERNRREYGERIHCGKGCCDCCSQLFQITEVEAAYISRAVKELPPEQRQRLCERARQYLPRREELLSAKNVPDAWGSLPPPGLRLPCPALENGACQIYNHRPLICRKYGMPLFNPAKPDRLFACELNFNPGEEVDVTDLVQIQTGIHKSWSGLNQEYNRLGLTRDPNPVTVARAILEDFESCMAPLSPTG
jgi:Fe-S-cluster containining protein